MYFELNSLAALRIREMQIKEGYEPCFGVKEECNEFVSLEFKPLVKFNDDEI